MGGTEKSVPNATSFGSNRSVSVSMAILLQCACVTLDSWISFKKSAVQLIVCHSVNITVLISGQIFTEITKYSIFLLNKHQREVSVIFLQFEAVKTKSDGPANHQ